MKKLDMNLPGLRASTATGMPIIAKKRLTPMQLAGLERTFYHEYRQRIKVGEAAPFASAMAARAQLIERNKILEMI